MPITVCGGSETMANSPLFDSGGSSNVSSTKVVFENSVLVDCNPDSGQSCCLIIICMCKLVLVCVMSEAEEKG